MALFLGSMLIVTSQNASTRPWNYIHRSRNEKYYHWFQ
jgi:hypothetical protein